MRPEDEQQLEHVLEALSRLARTLDYDVVIEPGPPESAGVIVWEARTVSLNSRLSPERQAEELIYMTSLLVERRERALRGLKLTPCQEAIVVELISRTVSSQARVAISGPRNAPIVNAWNGTDETDAIDIVDLLDRVTERIQEHLRPVA